jgi:hypothetical protein
MGPSLSRAMGNCRFQSEEGGEKGEQGIVGVSSFVFFSKAPPSFWSVPSPAAQNALDKPTSPQPPLCVSPALRLRTLAKGPIRQGPTRTSSSLGMGMGMGLTIYLRTDELSMHQPYSSFPRASIYEASMPVKITKTAARHPTSAQS